MTYDELRNSIYRELLDGCVSLPPIEFHSVDMGLWIFGASITAAQGYATTMMDKALEKTVHTDKWQKIYDKLLLKALTAGQGMAEISWQEGGGEVESSEAISALHRGFFRDGLAPESESARIAKITREMCK
jgi:hypothetical protein